VEPYFFAYLNAQASEEMLADSAKLEVVPSPVAPPVAPDKKELFEPSVIGDRPADTRLSSGETPLSAYAVESSATSHESPSNPAMGIEADPDLVKKWQTLQKDLDQHKRQPICHGQS
jgi:hypothetical protein